MRESSAILVPVTRAPICFQEPFPQADGETVLAILSGPDGGNENCMVQETCKPDPNRRLLAELKMAEGAASNGVEVRSPGETLMRQPRKFGMTCPAFVAAFAVGLLAQARPAGAQNTNSSAGDAPVVNRTEAISGPQGKIAADSQREARLLIAHGLEMTIEGSSLEGLVMRAAGVGAGTTIDPRPSPLGVVGSSSVTAPAPSTVRAPVPTSSAGTGFTGAAGETVSGRVVGNGETITPRTIVPGQPGTATPGVNGVAGPVTVAQAAPATPGETGSMLQRQAMRSFEAGERLLGAGMTGGPDEAFQRAAETYANTLRAIANQPVIRAAARVGDATTVRTPVGSVTVATTRVPRSAETIGADPGSVAMKIRAIVRGEGGSAGPNGQRLMEHAQMMESESRAIIRAFAGIGDAGPVPRAAGELGSTNGMVQTLAQQANDLIIAMGMGPLPGSPAR
jgi:hypothetical protein